MRGPRARVLAVLLASILPRAALAAAPSHAHFFGAHAKSARTANNLHSLYTHGEGATLWHAKDDKATVNRYPTGTPQQPSAGQSHVHPHQYSGGEVRVFDTQAAAASALRNKFSPLAAARAVGAPAATLSEAMSVAEAAGDGRLTAITFELAKQSSKSQKELKSVARAAGRTSYVSGWAADAPGGKVKGYFQGGEAAVEAARKALKLAVGGGDKVSFGPRRSLVALSYLAMQDGDELAAEGRAVSSAGYRGAYPRTLHRGVHYRRMAS